MKQLTKRVAETLNISQVAVKDILTVVFNEIEETLVSGQSVRIQNFGKFEVKTRAASRGVNPQTWESIMKDGYSYPSFKSFTWFKSKVKEKFKK